MSIEAIHNKDPFVVVVYRSRDVLDELWFGAGWPQRWRDDQPVTTSTPAVNVVVPWRVYSNSSLATLSG